MDDERKTQFIRALAGYLVGRQVVKSVRLQMGDVEAREWANLRNLTPIQGYLTVDEAEKVLAEWLLGRR